MKHNLKPYIHHIVLLDDGTTAHLELADPQNYLGKQISVISKDKNGNRFQKFGNLTRVLKSNIPYNKIFGQLPAT